MNLPSLSEMFFLDFSVSFVEYALSKRCPKGWNHKNISRHRNGLVLVREGAVRYRKGNEILLAEEGDVLFLKKDTEYALESVGETNLCHTVINFEIEPQEIFSMLPFSPVIKVQRHGRIREIFAAAEEVSFGKGICHQPQVKAMVTMLICELVHDIYGAQGGDDVLRIKAAADYIEESPHLHIKISALAELCGLSVSHFRKRFTEIYGLPPVRHLTKRRIEKAKDMLRAGMYSLDEIAVDCGFEDKAYFSRVFKKETGFAPSDF